MKDGERLVVIQSGYGDDWYCQHLVVPKDLDVKRERGRWRSWLSTRPPAEHYMDFGSWLRCAGAYDPSPADLERFHEDGD